MRSIRTERASSGRWAAGTSNAGQPAQPVEDATVLAVTAEWHVARARTAAWSVTEPMGFSRTLAAYVVTAISELATNLFFHATNGGTITLFRHQRDGRSGITVVAEDDGPGIPDIQQALLDGFTTNRGLGGGLPGIQRLMDEVEIESRVGAGTQVICRKWSPCS